MGGSPDLWSSISLFSSPLLRFSSTEMWWVLHSVEDSLTGVCHCEIVLIKSSDTSRITTTMKSCKSQAFPLFRALKASWVLYGVNDNVLPKAALSWAWRVILLLQGPCPKVLYRVRFVLSFLPTLSFCPSPLFLTARSPARQGWTYYLCSLHALQGRDISLCVPGKVRTTVNFFQRP